MTSARWSGGMGSGAVVAGRCGGETMGGYGGPGGRPGRHMLFQSRIRQPRTRPER